MAPAEQAVGQPSPTSQSRPADHSRFTVPPPPPPREHDVPSPPPPPPPPRALRVPEHPSPPQTELLRSLPPPPPPPREPREAANPSPPVQTALHACDSTMLLPLPLPPSSAAAHQLASETGTTNGAGASPAAHQQSADTANGATPASMALTLPAACTLECWLHVGASLSGTGPARAARSPLPKLTAKALLLRVSPLELLELTATVLSDFTPHIDESAGAVAREDGSPLDAQPAPDQDGPADAVFSTEASHAPAPLELERGVALDLSGLRAHVSLEHAMIVCIEQLARSTGALVVNAEMLKVGVQLSDDPSHLQPAEYRLSWHELTATASHARVLDRPAAASGTETGASAVLVDSRTLLRVGGDEGSSVRIVTHAGSSSMRLHVEVAGACLRLPGSTNASLMHLLDALRMLAPADPEAKNPATNPPSVRVQLRLRGARLKPLCQGMLHAEGGPAGSLELVVSTLLADVRIDPGADAEATEDDLADDALLLSSDWGSESIEVAETDAAEVVRLGVTDVVFKQLPYQQWIGVQSSGGVSLLLDPSRIAALQSLQEELQRLLWAPPDPLEPVMRVSLTVQVAAVGLQLMAVVPSAEEGPGDSGLVLRARGVSVSHSQFPAMESGAAGPCVLLHGTLRQVDLWQPHLDAPPLLIVPATNSPVEQGASAADQPSRIEAAAGAEASAGPTCAPPATDVPPIRDAIRFRLEQKSSSSMPLLEVKLEPLRAALDANSAAVILELTAKIGEMGLDSGVSPPDAGGGHPPAPPFLQIQLEPCEIEAWLLLVHDDAEGLPTCRGPEPALAPLATRVGLFLRLSLSGSAISMQQQQQIAAEVSLGSCALRALTTRRADDAAPGPSILVDVASDEFDTLLDCCRVQLHANARQPINAASTPSSADERPSGGGGGLVSLEVLTPLRVTVSALQLRLLNALHGQFEAIAVVAKGGAAAAADFTPSASVDTRQDAAGVSGSKSFMLEVSMAHGLELVFSTARRQRLPVARVLLPTFNVSGHQQGAAVVKQTVKGATFVEVQSWSRSAQTWEPLLERCAVQMQARQQREGTWSVHVESHDIELSMSEAMMRSMGEAVTATQRMLSAPTISDAISMREPHFVLHVGNLSGGLLRFRLCNENRSRELQPGQSTVVPLPEVSQRGSALSELAVLTPAGWYEVPPFPTGKTANIALIAKPAAGGARTLKESVAVRCVVRALPGATDGEQGFVLAVHSLLALQNSTEVPLELQLQLSDATGPGSSHALGVLKPGETLPIAPHHAGGRLQARPVTMGSLDPGAGCADGGPLAHKWSAHEEAFWLGSCSHTKQQARQLQRLQMLFALPETEQLRESWRCALSSCSISAAGQVPEGGAARLPSGGRAKGRLYLTSTSLCFVGSVLSRDVRRIVVLSQLRGLQKSKTGGVRSAAVTLSYGDAATLQFSGFSSRNRAFGALLRLLVPNLPHLVDSWNTPSSAKLRQQCGLPECEVSLQEYDATCDKVRGTMHFTPGYLCFVAASRPPWRASWTDVLRLRGRRAGASGAAEPSSGVGGSGVGGAASSGGSGSTAPLGADGGRAGGECTLFVYTRDAERGFAIRAALEEVVESLDGLLPTHVLDGLQQAVAERADEGVRDDDLAQASSEGIVLHRMRSAAADGASAFYVALRVQSEPCVLHGRLREAQPVQRSLVVLHPPLVLENTLPYDLTFGLTEVSHAVAPSGVVAAGRTLGVASMPTAGLVQLRLRMGSTWTSPLAEFSSGDWRSAVATRCTLQDPFERPAALLLERMPRGCGRSILALKVFAPLWVINRSQVPLRYRVTRRFGGKSRARGASKSCTDVLQRERRVGVETSASSATLDEASEATRASDRRPLTGLRNLVSSSGKGPKNSAAAAGSGSVVRRNNSFSALRGRLRGGKASVPGDASARDEATAATESSESTAAASDAAVSGGGAAYRIGGSVQADADSIGSGVTRAIGDKGGDDDDDEIDDDDGGESDREGSEADEAENEPIADDAGPLSTGSVVHADDEAGSGRPLLLSGQRVALSLRTGDWSKPLRCDVPGASLCVQLGAFEIGTEVIPPNAAAPRSRLLVIQPRFRILNRSPTPLLIRKVATPAAKPIPLPAADATPRPLHWGNPPPQSRLLQLARAAPAAAGDVSWSGAFPVDCVGDVVVALPTAGDGSPEQPSQLLLLVTVEANFGSLLVCVDRCAAAPYQLHNSCKFPLMVQQQGCAVQRALPAGSTVPYAWDEPTKPPLLLLSPLHQLGVVRTFEVYPDSIGEPIPHHDPPLLWTTVRLSEASRIVQITPRCPPDAEGSAELSLSLLCSLSSIGVSLVDSFRCQELLYARADGVSCSAMRSELELDTQLTVDRLQIDCQRSDAVFPTVILGQPAAAMRAPWLQFNLSRRRREKRVRCVGIAIQEIRLQLEEALLYALHSFFARATPTPTLAPSSSPVASNPGSGGSSGAHGASPVEVELAAGEEQLLLPSIARKRPWYVDELRLAGLKLLLSYRRPEHPLSAEERGSLRLPVSLPNVEALPLQLNSFEMLNRFFQRVLLTKQLVRHYRGEALRQVHKIVLHTELSGFVSGTLANLSGDVHYQRSRAAGRKTQARNVVEGVLHGGVGLGRGVFHGVTGLVSAPVRGASEAGVSGFAKGLGRGLIGVAVKPTAGVFELAAKTTEGFRNARRLTDASTALAAGRLRLPRMLLTAGRELRPYNEVEALGAQLLERVARGQYAGEPLVCCIQSAEAGDVVLLTDARLAVVRYDADLKPVGVMWQAPLHDIQNVRVDDKVPKALVVSVPISLASDVLKSSESGGGAQVHVEAVTHQDCAALLNALGDAL